MIALTASVFPVDRAACAQAGMDDFLSKLFQLAELERAQLADGEDEALSAERQVEHAGGLVRQDESQRNEGVDRPGRCSLEHRPEEVFDDRGKCALQ